MARIRSTRFQEYLKQLFNLEGGAVQDVQAVAPVWEATGLEHYRARGERLWAGFGEATGLAGTAPILSCGLATDPSSKMITVIEVVIVDLTTAAPLSMGLANTPPNAAVAVQSLDRDSRFWNPAFQTTVQTQISSENLAAPPASTDFSHQDLAAASAIAIPVGLVMRQGTRLLVRAAQLGVNTLRATFFGRERLIEPTEL